MKPDVTGRAHTLRIYLISLLSVVIITALSWALRDTLTLANIILIYLLLVVIIAVKAGLGPAYITSFLSFIVIEFFLVPPFGSVSIADPRELFDLFVFLVVAGIAGRLAANARNQAQQAQQRVQETEILYRLTSLFNTMSYEHEVYQGLTHVLEEDVGALQVQILPSDLGPASEDGGAVVFVMLQSGDKIYGTVRITFDARPAMAQSNLMHACVSQAALALNRIDLAESSNKSRQYEEADRLKTAILRSVSHDLRTPITIIKTSAGNLRQLQNQLTNQEITEIVETIDQEIDHLDNLVGNLLDLSRLQAGAMHLNRQLNDLEEMSGDVAARIWHLTKQERIKIVFPEDMPLVSFDYGLLLQAVSNLVDNSLRFEPAETQVEIHGSADERHARLAVVNHGETMEASLKERLMGPFIDGLEGHTGLGLPIARGIIEAHHGSLIVEDTPGGGATFLIELLRNEETGNETQDPGRR